MVTTASSSSMPDTATDRATLRAMGERRRRVLRSAIVVISIMLAIAVLSTINRDQQAVTSCRERMESAVGLLQEHATKGLRGRAGSPRSMLRTELGQRWRDHVFHNEMFNRQKIFRQKVGVCCCKQPHSSLLWAPGRYVIIYDAQSQKHQLLWLEEKEFDRRANELGLRVRM